MTEANTGADQTVLNQSQVMLPGYQEEYLKNIAINTAIETVEDNSIVN